MVASVQKFLIGYRKGPVIGKASVKGKLLDILDCSGDLKSL
jgi:hypothetical protein